MSVDINQLATDPNYDLNIARSESAEERTARIARENADAATDRRMRERLFYVALAVVVLALGVSLYVAFLKDTVPADEKQWGRTVFSALVAGLLAFLTGRTLAKSQPRA